MLPRGCLMLIVCYNVLSLADPWRLHEIADEHSKADAILLQSTQKKPVPSKERE